MDDLKSTLELYKQEIDSKNTMLSQTKSDRNAANIKSKKIEMEQDQSKMEILTQKEQNTNLKKQVKILQVWLKLMRIIKSVYNKNLKITIFL